MLLSGCLWRSPIIKRTFSVEKEQNDGWTIQKALGVPWNMAAPLTLFGRGWVISRGKKYPEIFRWRPRK